MHQQRRKVQNKYCILLCNKDEGNQLNRNPSINLVTVGHGSIKYLRPIYFYLFQKDGTVTSYSCVALFSFLQE